jgi:hypothetical protein
VISDAQVPAIRSGQIGAFALFDLTKTMKGSRLEPSSISRAQFLELAIVLILVLELALVIVGAMK